MMHLNGVRGFNIPNLAIPNNEHYFKMLCYAVVLNCGGNIIAFNEPKMARNYYEVKINILNENYFILLNHVYPFITFASSVEGSRIVFANLEKLAREFAQHYRVLSVDELDESLIINETKERVRLENQNELNGAEMGSVKHSQSRRVGDVIFNRWDKSNTRKNKNVIMG